MKKAVYSILLILLFATNLSAQTESKVTFKPEKPKFGDSLTVIFTPGSKSPLIKADTVLMQVQYYKVQGSYFIEEYNMVKQGLQWERKFKLIFENIGCILFQFSDSEHNEIDHNDFKAWDILVYDNNESPVKGAYSARAHTYMSTAIMRRNQNMEEYSAGKLKELELYPDDPKNIASSWYVRSRLPGNRDSIKLVINKEADLLLQKYPDSLEVLKSVYYHYIDSDKKKAEEIFSKINEIDPKNDIALHIEWNKIIFMPQGEERLKTYFDYYQKAKGTNWENGASIEYYRSMIGAKYYDQAIKFLDEWKKPSLVDVIVSGAQIIETCKMTYPVKSRNEVMNKLEIENTQEKTNSMIIKAKEIIQKAISQFQKQTVSDRNRMTTPSAWKSERKRFISVGFTFIGTADYLLKNYESAEKYFIKAKELGGKEFYHPQLCGDYIKCLFELKKYAQAFDLGIKIFEENNWDKFADIKEILLASAKELKDPKYNVKTKLDAIAEHNKVLRAKEIKENFKSRFRKAPDFSIIDLDGKEYSLADLKGKIIILEFWDTNCGWCEKSAPYFQEFYIKHKNDKDLVILSVNCDPTPDQKDKNKFVTDFLKDKGWKFPIAIDIENQVTRKIRPGGVPTTFFIGPDSWIYYTESGFSGTTMVEDFETIVNMIRTN